MLRAHSLVDNPRCDLGRLDPFAVEDSQGHRIDERAHDAGSTADDSTGTILFDDD